VPLGLYLILRKQISPEVAFFSSYFYISIRPFYTWISEFIKQGTAMFFLMLIILVLTSKRGEGRIADEILLLLFSFSLITSHYGTSYVFMLSLVVVYIFLLYRDKKLAGSLTTYLSLYIVLAISWYMHVSEGSAFETILNIGNHIISNIQYLFNPEAAGGLRMLTYTTPILSYKILKILHLFTDFFIVFGFVSVAYHKLRGNGEIFSEEFFSFSIPSLGFLLLSMVLPYFIGVGSMGFQRIYTIVLFFLAPFCIIGVTRFMQGIEKGFSISFGKLELRFLAVFFAIFLLFNSGWVTEVTKEYIGSVALSQARIKCYGTVKEKVSLYCRYFAEEDILSARWLSKYAVSTKVSSDFYATRVLHSHAPEMFLGKGDPWGRDLLTNNTIKELDEGTYIYLRKLNWEDRIMTKFCREKDWIWNTSDIIPYLNQMNKIYSNGGSVIFLH